MTGNENSGRKGAKDVAPGAKSPGGKASVKVQNGQAKVKRPGNQGNQRRGAVDTAKPQPRGIVDRAYDALYNFGYDNF